MSKNIKNLKNKKIIAATGMALFSLVTVFTATIAWFATNHDVSGSGMTLKVKSTEGVELSGIEVYKCISNKCTYDDSGNVATLVFDQNSISSYGSDGSAQTGSTTLIMEDYGDFINSDPVLMLFTLQTDSTLNIVASTRETSFGAAVTSSNQNRYPLSNAIYFRYSETITTNSDGNYVTSVLSGNSSFVINPNQAGSLSSNINVYSSGTSVVHQVGIIVDYYAAAVEYIKTNLLSLDGISRVGFACDWSLEVTQ